MSKKNLIITRQAARIITLDFAYAKGSDEARLSIKVESKADVTLIEAMPKNSAREYQIELLISRFAKVKYIVMPTVNDKLRVTRSAFVRDEARITWYDLAINETDYYSKITSELVCDGASATTYGIFIGKNKQNFRMDHTTIHMASHTESKMLTRGILKDVSRASYRGLIEIKRGMDECRAQEKTDVLLMSDATRVDVAPQLKIENENVKCSHAVTITRVDENKLFYIESRGLTRQKATDVLARAHLAPVLDELQDPDIRETLLSRL